MQVLVKTRDLEIKVQDIEGYQVCTTCRGGKELYERTYYNERAYTQGGLLSVSRPYACPKCSGQGFWKEQGDKNDSR